MDEGAAAPDRLLAHCAALAALDDVRPPAYRRLEQALGTKLARFLVAALAGRRSRRNTLAA
jgi:hypothetical protein